MVTVMLSITPSWSLELDLELESFLISQTVLLCMSVLSIDFCENRLSCRTVVDW